MAPSLHRGIESVIRLQKAKRYFVTSLREERMLTQWVTSIMIAVHWGLGLSVIIGGQARFTIPTYQPIIDLTNGHVWIWGLAIMAAAGLMMTPYKWPNVTGLWLGMVWMIMWSTLFGVALANYDEAAATPLVAYAGFALINAALLTIRVLENPRSGGVGADAD